MTRVFKLLRGHRREKLSLPGDIRKGFSQDGVLAQRLENE